MAQSSEERLASMRAYAKTPAGIDSKKVSQARWIAKRRSGSAPIKDTLKVTPPSLISAMANWRTN
jgi:hypothetical protein